MKVTATPVLAVEEVFTPTACRIEQAAKAIGITVSPAVLLRADQPME